MCYNINNSEEGKMVTTKITPLILTAVLTSALLSGCAFTGQPGVVVTAAPTITAVPNVDKSPIEMPFSTIVNNGEIRLQEGSLVNITGIDGNLSDWKGKSSNETTAIFIQGDSSTSPSKAPQLILYNAGSTKITLNNSSTGETLTFKIITEQNKNKADTEIVIK